VDPEAGQRFQHAERRSVLKHIILAGKDWDCSTGYGIPDVKVTSTEGGKPNVTYKKADTTEDFRHIQKCVVRGLEEAETGDQVRWPTTNQPVLQDQSSAGGR